MEKVSEAYGKYKYNEMLVKYLCNQLKFLTQNIDIIMKSASTDMNKRAYYIFAKYSLHKQKIVL